MIGFTVIWILLETTQGKTHPISPVTALWIIAIPLMDMVAIMYRRLRKGMSPFLTGPSAYSSFDHARRVYFPSGVCVDYPCRCYSGCDWRRGGIHPHFIPEWVMLVLFLLAFFHLRLLH